MKTSSDILTEAAKGEAEIKSRQVTPLMESEFWATTGTSRQSTYEGDSILLGEAESQRFVEALLAAPSKPTQRCNQALNTYRESVVER